MKPSRTILAIAAALLPLSAAAASDADHDPRPLRAEEQKTFFPLVCAKAVTGKKTATCAKLIGYPGVAPNGRPFSFTLDAVSYGAFTAGGADQAYVSYGGDFEIHANGFGGGILFERAGGSWKFKAWYPGRALNDCVALPGGPTLRLLCLGGYTGQGEADTSVSLIGVPANPKDEKAGRTFVLKAQDAREGINPSYQCTLKRGSKEAILLSILSLKRSKQPGVLAEASVSYIDPSEAATACGANDLTTAGESSGVVRFKLSGGGVVAQTPVPFAKADY